MFQYKKMSDLKSILNRILPTSNLVCALFQDNCELESFEFSVSSEYDDNNYSDHIRLCEINGYYVDWDMNYEYEEDYDSSMESIENKEKSNLPKVNRDVCWAISDVVNQIGSEYCYGEHVFLREQYLGKMKIAKDLDKYESKYIFSYLSKQTIPEEWFLTADPKWATYYAEDHGRFSKEVETEIFCAKGRMMYAYMYAQALKRSLPKSIETFWTTSNLVDSNEDDNLWFKEYLKYKKNVLEKTVAK